MRRDGWMGERRLSPSNFTDDDGVAGVSFMEEHARP